MTQSERLTKTEASDLVILILSATDRGVGDRLLEFLHENCPHDQFAKSYATSAGVCCANCGGILE